jgi:uncharacterized protein (TIGR03437 family)
MSGNQQLVPDSWRQLYNPDRYTGNEYVSSFDLQLQPNADGSLTATAGYPGRYKIAAIQGGQQYTAAVVVPPAQPPVKMKGIDFGMSGPVNRTYAPSAIALASHIGADWAQVQASVCMDLNTAGVYQYTDPPPSWCPYGTPLSDLGWVIDELHAQGFKVMIFPTAWGYYQGVFDELEDFLPGSSSSDAKIPSSQVLNLFQGWAQMALSMATIVAQHQAEVYVPGSHDTGYAQFDSTTTNALNAAWITLIQNIRAVYKGQVWWGPVDPCGVSFPFTNYSLVDGIWFEGLTVSASTPPCTFPSPPGINNIHAEQMLSYVRTVRSAGSSFSLGQKQGLPMLWTDFTPTPIDGMNYLQGHFNAATDGVQSYANPNSGVRDYQEPVDFLDAVMQAGVFEGRFQAVFPSGVSLNGPYFDDILSQMPVLVSLTNWYGGDVNYFAPCMASFPSDVLFQLLPNCPVALQQALINPNSLTLINDSTSSVTPYFEGTTESTVSPSVSFGDPSWTDYDVNVAVRIQTSLSLFLGNVREHSIGAQYGSYQAVIGQGSVKLIKITPGNAGAETQTTLAQAALPGKFDPTHWYQVDITAIGNSIVVKIDGSQLIQYTDTASPYLAGSFGFVICCGTSGTVDDFGNIVVHTIPGPQLSVVNSASFEPGVVSPGEIVALFGSQIGPQTLVVADGTNGYPTSLSGTQVLFNGIPAPLIYTQAAVVSAIVPWELIGNTTAAVTAQYQGASSAPVTVAVAGSSTALFTATGEGFGAGAILNQDYSSNSPSNPASAGSAIILYGTGGGAFQGSATDGAVAAGAAQLTASVSVLVGGQPAQVLYAGAAPDLVNGVVQINVQLPAGITGAAVPVLATVGQYISQSVTVAIQ